MVTQIRSPEAIGPVEDGKKTSPNLFTVYACPVSLGPCTLYSQKPVRG